MNPSTPDSEPKTRIELARFRPRLLDALADYHRSRFAKDVIAGITVGIVALPLAMAFAIASGLPPQAGLITAVIAGFLISALGGSPVQIGGPAGAYIVIVYGIVERYGVPNLLIATAMAGVLLFLMGLLRLGALVRFVPVAVIIGFTNGIAVLIALSQVKDFFGLRVDNLPADFFGKLAGIWAYAHTANLYALALAAGSLALIVLWQWLMPSLTGPSALRGKLTIIPGTIVALIAATAVAALLELPVDTIGNRFGGVPQALPVFTLPAFTWDTVKILLPPAVTIAVLGAIESLLCARVADTQLGAQGKAKHDPNQELMAQGIANTVT
ncbi:MAG: SulP family inorganic anion transporter, partial [Burkholderiaceae bacterium]